MKTEIKSQNAKKDAVGNEAGQRGFSLTEMMIALMVFTIIAGSVLLLLSKSQAIFRSEQGVSGMDQNARLLMDFITRDIQQSKENGLGLGPKFRSIYSNDNAEGKTDEVTIVSGETDTKVPAGALPLIPASQKNFSTADRYVELVPNGALRVAAADVANSIVAREEFLVSGYRADGSTQFDFIKVSNVKITSDGAIGMGFETVNHPGVEPEVPFGAVYENGGFTMRPCTIKRYFVDRKTDKDHPSLALSINDGPPINIARNVVAFQLRYLEMKDGETEGAFVKQQNISREYKTQAIEVTMTARTEIDGDKQAERLVTLASVVRPRMTPSGSYGSSPGGGGTSSPGLPGDGSGGPGGGGFGGDPGDGGTSGTGNPRGYDADGNPVGGGTGGGGIGDGSGGSDGNPYNRRTRRIGRSPKLGERLNQRPGTYDER